MMIGHGHGLNLGGAIDAPGLSQRDSYARAEHTHRWDAPVRLPVSDERWRRGSRIGKLLVSIHDVTPAHEIRVRALWRMCRVMGVTPALFVVPNWHGRWPIERHPAFAHWLRDRVAEGAEVFLHGERHDEHGITRSMRDELRAFGMTAAEGEFLTLPAVEAERRIVRGLRTLARCGIEPIGFAPPAWLAHRECGSAVSDCGLQFFEDLSSIHLSQRGTRLPSPVTRWSARHPWREAASRFVARTRFVLDQRSWLVRVALHPADLTSTTIQRSVVDTMRRWLAVRIPWRYSDL